MSSDIKYLNIKIHVDTIRGLESIVYLLQQKTQFFFTKKKSR